MDTTLGLAWWLWALIGVLIIYIDRRYEYKTMAGFMFASNYPFVLPLIGILCLLNAMVALGWFTTA